MTEKLWPSAFVAILFALHPLHVESVAWISERKDVLSTFFLLLALWMYQNYARHLAAGRYILVLFCFALGLMAKPMLVTLPFVLLLLDFWPLMRYDKNQFLEEKKNVSGGGNNNFTLFRRYTKEKIPLFVLVVASSIITFIVQRRGGAMVYAEELPLLYRIANAGISYLRYIGKLIVPVDLAVFYPHPGSPFSWWFICGSIILI